MIEIHQQDGHLRMVADGPQHRLLQAVPQQNPVGQAGQRIVVSELLDLLFRLFAFGDVLHHGHEIIHDAVWPAHAAA